MSRLTAMEIEKQDFRRKVRGYDPDDVQMYLRSVAEEVERLHLENGEFSRKSAGSSTPPMRSAGASRLYSRPWSPPRT